jgi:hypothetical protein
MDAITTALALLFYCNQLKLLDCRKGNYTIVRDEK